MKKILVIQTASIGDVILATPLIEKLHSAFPQALIDIMVSKGKEKLFINHPFLNDILIWDKTRWKYLNLFHLVLQTRKNHYDIIVNIQRFASTGLIVLFSGAKQRIGFSKNPFSLFYTERVIHRIGTGTHEVMRNLTLLASIAEYSDTIIKPRLYPSQEDFDRVRCYTTDSYYTISPGSLWFTKQFPVEKWIEFLRQVDKESPFLYLGSKEDHEMIDIIIRKTNHKNSVNLSGHLSLLESAALMKDAAMNFTNDSAPLHLASSVNAPVTVIYCSTVPAFGFGPLSDQSYIVETMETLSCRPCGLHGFKTCPEKHFKCAISIKPEQLLDLFNKY